MASKRVCPHAITLYNYLGETDGKARYARTLITNVHVSASGGIAAGDVSRDGVRVYVFDDVSECEKLYLPCEKWAAGNDHERYWTVHTDGSDYIALGDMPDSDDGTLPTQHTLYKINSISRRQIGSRRVWHWRIEAQ